MKKKYTIKGIDCPSCALLIEAELEEENIKAKVNYASSVLEIESQTDEDAEKDTEGRMIKTVQKLGYTVET